ncbi:MULTISPECIES: Gfo/Idh/MocA family protein [Blautia]|uniref:Gfo/Idh/MocA family protein n=1 Tax=Blautia TaxID=572511 RepID=UPI000BA42E8A|nr:MULTISPECIES: Gfo/Idh/MocA family oxidoreductase [Blautia]
MVDRVKIGVIGAGGISYTYLKNMTETFHITEVVGIADVVEERSKRRAEQFHIRQMTVDEIMEDPDIEIVVNLTYPLSHYEITKKALEAGKHVFSEKMMSTDFVSAKELYDLAKKKGLRIGQAPDTFLGGGLQTARNLIDKGLIGEPVNAQAMVARCYNLTQDENHPNLPFVFTAGGSLPYDMGCYYLHALIHLLGPVARVNGLSKAFHEQDMQRNPRNPGYNKPFDMKFPTSLTGALDFYNGCYGTFTAISDSHREQTARLEIYGTEGTLILQDPNYFYGPVLLARGQRGEETASMPLTHGYGQFTPETADMSGEERTWRDSFRGIGVADMAWAIRNNRAHRCSAELGLHAIEIIDGIGISCKEEKMYHMTTKPEQPAMIPQGFIYGTAAEACLDTY